MDAPDAAVAHPKVDHTDNPSQHDPTRTDDHLAIEAQRIRGAVAHLSRFHIFQIDNPLVPYCDGVKTRTHDPKTCDKRGKHPVPKSWSEASTQDPDTIARWWGGKRPYNIGVDCGASGIFVIDEDEAGVWAKLCADLGHQPPETFTVETANGNHYYFLQPEGSPIPNEGPLTRRYHMNVRGGRTPDGKLGGYVVAPGSLHQLGVIYKIANRADIASAPGWLVDAITGKTTLGTDKDVWETISGPAKVKDHDWWREDKIPHGQHHNAIVAAGGWCREVGLSKDEAKPYVRDVVSRLINGGYTLDQAYAELDDVYARYKAGTRLEERRNGTSGDEHSSPNEDEDPFLNWSEFWNHDRSDEDWLIDGVLARGRGHAIYAAHKEGKSLFLLHGAAHLAVDRTDVDSIYLDYEMSDEDVWERLTDLGYGPDTDLSRLHYDLLPNLPALDTGEGMAALMRHVDRVERPGCHVAVFIDTTGRAVQGDENDADTFRDFYRWSGTALKRRGVTWARADHAGKDVTRGQRGSSAKGDDVDVIWRLQKADDGIVLHRDAARMSWVEDKLTFALHTDPLRYERTGELWPDGTKELAAELDRLGVALDAGRPKAREALKAAGQKARNNLLSAALKWRRREAGTGAGTALDDLIGTGERDSGDTHPLTCGDSSGDRSGQLSTVNGDRGVSPEGDTLSLTQPDTDLKDDLPCLVCTGPPHDTTTHMYVADDGTPF